MSIEGPAAPGGGGQACNGRPSGVARRRAGSTSPRSGCRSRSARALRARPARDCPARQRRPRRLRRARSSRRAGALPPCWRDRSPPHASVPRACLGAAMLHHPASGQAGRPRFRVVRQPARGPAQGQLTRFIRARAWVKSSCPLSPHEPAQGATHGFIRARASRVGLEGARIHGRPPACRCPMRGRLGRADRRGSPACCRGGEGPGQSSRRTDRGSACHVSGGTQRWPPRLSRRPARQAGWLSWCGAAGRDGGSCGARPKRTRTGCPD